VAVRLLVWLCALGIAGCDCYSAYGTDARPDAASAEAGLSDASGDGGEVVDSGNDSGAAEPRCGGDLGQPCPSDTPYCCGRYGGIELVVDECFDRPTMPVEGEERTRCWERPDPAAVIPRTCGPEDPCPSDHGWCCSGWVGRSYCSRDALFGWPCVDSTGVLADDTWGIDKNLIRDCAERERCPEQDPYCCDNLFCAAQPYYGWVCAIP